MSAQFSFHSVFSEQMYELIFNFTNFRSFYEKNIYRGTIPQQIVPFLKGLGCSVFLIWRRSIG